MTNLQQVACLSQKVFIHFGMEISINDQLSNPQTDIISNSKYTRKPRKHTVFKRTNPSDTIFPIPSCVRNITLPQPFLRCRRHLLFIAFEHTQPKTTRHFNQEPFRRHFIILLCMRSSDKPVSVEFRPFRFLGACKI